MKAFIYSIIVAVIVIGGVVLLTSDTNKPRPESIEGPTNVSVLNGKQVIAITAKGGYWPRTTEARSNMPTVIKVITSGTFDCSAALTFPSLKSRTFLQPTGETLIEIPAQPAGAVVKGVCAMGMYSFAIYFN